MPKTKKQSIQVPLEKDIQKQITDYLTAEQVWWMRLNTGAFSGSYKGKKRFVRFAKPGTADILAWLWNGLYGEGMILWIECKRPKQEQSDAQKAFQYEVELAGHHYIVANSYEQVEEYISFLKE